MQKEYKIFKNFIVGLIIISFFLPCLSFATTTIKQPENIQEAQSFFSKAIQKLTKELPSAIKKLFQEQIIPIWTKMWNWTKNLWENRLRPFLYNLWYSNLKAKIKGFIENTRNFFQEKFHSKIKPKEQEIQQEFIKEKKEMEEDVSRITHPLRDRINNFFGNIKSILSKALKIIK
ncbi:hypothetical protein J7K24_02210 [bacterium]|nr:hypothetical protein [bacterium]